MASRIFHWKVRLETAPVARSERDREKDRERDQGDILSIEIVLGDYAHSRLSVSSH